MATSTVSNSPSSTTAAAQATCTTAIPGKYGYVPPDACNSNYNFDPQFAPAVAVAVLFGMLTLAHLVLAIVFRKRFAWVLIMGAAWETAAFVTGALGAHDQQSQAFALAHTLLFLLAPLWINAFAYMTFARIVHYYLPDQSVWRIRGAALAKYFVWADVLAFLVQAAGASMISPGASASTVQNGLHIYTGGIGLQEAFVLFFIALMIGFHRKAAALERAGADHGLRERGWRQPLYALYGVLFLVSVRIIYRIAEYAGGMGPSNPLPLHEAYAYVLDAVPMILALLLLAIFYPGRFLVGPDSEFPKLTHAEKRMQRAWRKVEKMEMTTARAAGADAPPSYA